MTHELHEVADVADLAGFLLELDDAAVEKYARRDLLEVHQFLTSRTFSFEHFEQLARSARVTHEEAEAWLQGTAALCLLGVAGEFAGELPERLNALSWAWGRVPRSDFGRALAAYDDVLTRAEKLDLIVLREEFAREAIEA